MMKKLIVLSTLLASVSGFAASSALVSRLNDPYTQNVIAKREAEGLNLIAVNDANNLSKFLKGTPAHTEDRIRILFARKLSQGYARHVCQITFGATPTASCKEVAASIQTDNRANLDSPTE